MDVEHAEVDLRRCETSLSESGPEPGLRMLQRVAGHVERRVDGVRGEVERDRDRRGRAGSESEPQPATASASTRKTRATRFMRPMTVACPGVLTDRVRLHCAERRRRRAPRQHRSDAEIAPGGISGLDATLHFLEGSPEDVARYVLILDAINFGSGWFGELRHDHRRAHRAPDRARARRGAPWTAAELRALDAAAVGETLGLPEPPAHPPLLGGAEPPRAVPRDRPMLDLLGDSAEDLAERLAAGMPFFDDRGFYKRAQIAANDLHLAGVVDFPDIDRLTIFADNLVPHVLRLDGVLRYSDELAQLIDAGRSCPRAASSSASCAAARSTPASSSRASSASPRALLDNWLWNRGQRRPTASGPAHIARTVYY